MIDQAPELALRWHREGRAVALATVIETWGSAPRPVGSQLVIDADGAMEGSVSGGCVEGAVIVEAMEAIGDGRSRVLEFGVSDDDAFAVGLACGGRIRVLIEPVGGVMPVALLEALVDARAARRAVAYVADLEGDDRTLRGADEFEERFRLDRSGIEADGRHFVAVHNPPLKMVIVGAVHIAQHLAAMARACSHAPIIVDPRPAFGAQARFPAEDIRDGWPDEAMAEIGLDQRTSVITLTHDPKLDDPAIRSALKAPVYYLGCLGSTRTHAKRIARLTEDGFSEAELARIHAPVGLDLGGRSPAEIAVSIMAEVTRSLRGPKRT